MMKLVARACAPLCLSFAASAWSATPATLTLTEADRDVPKTSTDGPFLVPNYSYTESFLLSAGSLIGLDANGDSFTCDDATNPCGIVDVVVDLPADYPARRPTDKIRITLSWVSQESDLDMHVYKAPYDTASGNFFRQSRQNPPAPESVEFFPEPGLNTYRVYTVPAAPAAVSTTVTAVLSSGPSAVVTPTVKLGGPTFQNYQPPANLSSFTNSAGEPTLGVDLGTNRAYMMFNLDTLEARFDDSVTPATAIWTNLGRMGAPTTADPFLTMDQHRLPDGSVNHRVWIAQLFAANSYIAYTEANNYLARPGDCPTAAPNLYTGPALYCNSSGAGQVHGVDNQSIVVGPYPNNTKPATASPARTYPHAMYYCSHQAVNAFCSRSDDGGMTFNPSRPIFELTDGCNNHGHVKVGGDGTVYVPINNICQGREGVSVSIDAGETWHYLTVPGTANGRWDSSIAISNDGKTVWYGYAEQGDDRPMIIKGTLDKSDVNNPVIHWIEPAIDVGAPAGLKNIAFNTVVAGDKDRAAYIFHGTTATGNSGDTNTFNANAPWYLYVATTFDGGQTWELSNATPNDPIQRGVICDGGLGSPCESAGTRNLLDFMDADIDGQGRIVVAYADGCVSAQCIAGTAAQHAVTGKIARQVDGKRMLAAFDPVVVIGPPGATALEAARSSRAVNLSWTAPSQGGSPISSYRLERSADGGAFRTLATLVGSATKYDDATAIDASVAYAYRLFASNADGSGPSSNVVTPELPVESICDTAGLGVHTDKVGDVLIVGTLNGVPIGGTTEPKAGDLRALHVREPYLADGQPRLAFLLKVEDLSGQLPPNSAWFVSFDGAAGKRFAVRMATDQQRAVRFESYEVAADNNGGKNGQFIVAGTLKPADAASGFAANGLITLVAKAADVGLTPGQVVTNLFAGDTVLVGVSVPATPVTNPTAPGASFAYDFMPDDAKPAGAVQTVAAKECAPNQAPDARLSATPSTGAAPLDVRFDASASDDADAADPQLADTIESYVFDFGDGSAPVSQAMPVIDHRYGAEGAYAVTLHVQDSRGKTSSPARTQIVVESVEEADLVPDAFTFIDRTGVATSVFVTSETRTITGFTGPLPVGIDNGGQYRINGGAWVSAGGQINPGETLTVRHVSASTPGTAKVSAVTVGGYQTNFRSVTSTIDQTPDAFGFATQTSVERSTVIESDVITLTGYNTAVPVIAGPGASYRINGGAWTMANGTLQVGDTLQTRHTSSANPLTYTKTYVKAGGVTGYFTTRTK